MSQVSAYYKNLDSRARLFKNLDIYPAVVYPSSKISSMAKPNLKFQSLHIGNSRMISDCRVCDILKTLPGCRVSRHYLEEIYRKRRNMKGKTIFSILSAKSSKISTAEVGFYLLSSKFSLFQPKFMASRTFILIPWSRVSTWAGDQVPGKWR